MNTLSFKASELVPGDVLFGWDYDNDCSEMRFVYAVIPVSRSVTVHFVSSSRGVNNNGIAYSSDWELDSVIAKQR